MDVRTTEIADGIYRFSTLVPEIAAPAGFSFNQYLINADQPLLFHTGPRGMFEDIRAALGRIVPVAKMRWISFGHIESDECGSMNQWLAAAPEGPASGIHCAEGGCRRAGPGNPSAQKKHDRGWGRRGMRYPASEKVEIIRLVEQSSLPVRRTLDQIGVSRATFYRWYDRYQTGGPEALEDRPGRPSRVWNRIPDEVRAGIIELALEQSELSPRELAVRF
jgi:hypothetical protein